MQHNNMNWFAIITTCNADRLLLSLVTIFAYFCSLWSGWFRSATARIFDPGWHSSSLPSEVMEIRSCVQLKVHPWIPPRSNCKESTSWDGWMLHLPINSQDFLGISWWFIEPRHMLQIFVICNQNVVCAPVRFSSILQKTCSWTYIYIVYCDNTYILYHNLYAHHICSFQEIRPPWSPTALETFTTQKSPPGFSQATRTDCLMALQLQAEKLRFEQSRTNMWIQKQSHEQKANPENGGLGSPKTWPKWFRFFFPVKFCLNLPCVDRWKKGSSSPGVVRWLWGCQWYLPSSGGVRIRWSIRDTSYS